MKLAANASLLDLYSFLINEQIKDNCTLLFYIVQTCITALVFKQLDIKHRGLKCVNWLKF